MIKFIRRTLGIPEPARRDEIKIDYRNIWFTDLIIELMERTTNEPTKTDRTYRGDLLGAVMRAKTGDEIIGLLKGFRAATVMHHYSLSGNVLTVVVNKDDIVQRTINDPDVLKRVGKFCESK